MICQQHRERRNSHLAVGKTDIEHVVQIWEGLEGGLSASYLSFAALMTTGSMVLQVVSGPSTGARKDTVSSTVMRYR